MGKYTDTVSIRGTNRKKKVIRKQLVGENTRQNYDYPSHTINPMNTTNSFFMRSTGPSLPFKSYDEKTETATIKLSELKKYLSTQRAEIEREIWNEVRSRIEILRVKPASEGDYMPVDATLFNEALNAVLQYRSTNRAE